MKNDRVIMARDEEYMRWAYQYLRGEGFPPGEARKMRSWTIERILKAIEKRRKKEADAE